MVCFIDCTPVITMRRSNRHIAIFLSICFSSTSATYASVERGHVTLSLTIFIFSVSIPSFIKPYINIVYKLYIKRTLELITFKTIPVCNNQLPFSCLLHYLMTHNCIGKSIQLDFLFFVHLRFQYYIHIHPLVLYQNYYH